MGIIEQLEELKQQGLEAISQAKTTKALDDVRVSFLGKKGSLTQILRGLGSLSKEERPAVGKISNEVRQSLESALEDMMNALKAQELDERISSEKLDITLPGRKRPLGSQHLINNITDEIIEIFMGIGYNVAQGPEVELEYYNFTALNHEPQHPARSASDTFYVRDLSGDELDSPEPSEVLMRTQTSPMQVRIMEKSEPPIYVLCSGKVYRRDVADPSHLPQFTQVEGLVVDEGITFADLKGTLDHFVKEMFGPDRKTRFRPHFFPFTEPSAEVDVSCGICGGKGCRFCGNTGWIEILGCGMVDPNVFGFSGIDAEKYSGFAFGMGVERIACLKHNIPDLRMLIEGDMRFLTQF